ncbi:MAG: HAMP domain-containing protein [Dehalococcoidia bacterium]|nr:HAMP domain-containing protein [Dehalococcoidia bacterium]
MSLRLRVVLVSVGATALVVVLAGATLLALVSRDQHAELDDRLLREAAELAHPALLTASFGEGRVIRGERTFDFGVAARLTVDGRAVAVTESFPALSDDGDSEGLTTVSGADGEWRVLSQAVPVPMLNPHPQRGSTTSQDFGPIYLQVAASTSGVEATLRALRNRVIAVGVVAVGGVGLASWSLGTLALRPLGRLREEAERVSGTHDLGVRVPVDQGPPEVDELAASLNRMLERIGEATGQTEAALEAARAFASNAAHELRTPLTSMQTNLDVLERNPGLSPDQRADVVRDLAEQQRRLLASLDALRLLARGDLRRDDVFETLDLTEVLDAAVDGTRRRFPDATFTLDVAEGGYPMRGWPEGLASLVENLLRNAVTHGRHLDAAPEARVTLRRGGDRALLEVIDHGPGIPPEERPRVLERFARGLAARGEGSGLGLSLAAQQATLHDGTLSLDATPGSGTTVRVALPLLVAEWAGS